MGTIAPPRTLSLLIVCCIVLASFATASIPAAADTPRILLVGDSWAWFMWLNRSFQQALDNTGFEEFEEAGLYSTVPGSRARQWVHEDWLANITKECERHPSLDIIHVSLGGNDFLNNWKPSMPLADRDKLFQQVVDDLEVVIKHCLAIRPNIRVAIVNYDYINKKKGDGTVADLNNAGMILAKMKKDLAQRYDRVEYIQNYGLMQYHYGIADIPPKTVPYPGQAPDFEPFPGGSREHGNPEAAMFDSIHLNKDGYLLLAEHCIKVLYGEWLENPLAAVESATAKSAAQ